MSDNATDWVLVPLHLASTFTVHYAGNIFWLFIVALVWGTTNPWMKRGSQGLEVRGMGAGAKIMGGMGWWRFILMWFYDSFCLEMTATMAFPLTLSFVDLSGPNL